MDRSLAAATSAEPACGGFVTLNVSSMVLYSMS
jgi:hypothetical protein